MTMQTTVMVITVPVLFFVLRHIKRARIEGEKDVEFIRDLFLKVTRECDKLRALVHDNLVESEKVEAVLLKEIKALKRSNSAYKGVVTKLQNKLAKGLTEETT